MVSRLLALLVWLCVLVLPLATQAQKAHWRFLRKSMRKTTIPFRLVNNLVVVQLTINNSTPLNFIVDTGLKSTLITELSYNDSLTLISAEPATIRGLGSSEPINVLLTKRNTIRLGSLVGANQEVLVMVDNVFHLSERLGMRIHGIIGYELFKDHVIEMSYSQKLLRIWRPDAYRYKPSKRTESLLLSWHRYKPYINMEVHVSDSCAPAVMHMLVDTGSSDALWVFKSSLDECPVPTPNISGYLGHGLSGEVYGEKARIKGFSLGRFQLKKPIVAFPDSSSLASAMEYELRSGSVGGEVLSRFDVVFDYRNSLLTLRRNSAFGKPFFFNQSGIDLSTPFPNMPIYVIAELRNGSPADVAGLKPDDRLVQVNRKPASNYTLGELQAILAGGDGRDMVLMVERDGKWLVFNLLLKAIL